MSHGPVKDKLLKKAFHEIKENEPSIVGKTRRKSGAKAARKQEIAIAFSKARRGDV
jgi:hypothetical protein